MATRPTLGNINLPKDEVVRILIEKRDDYKRKIDEYNYRIKNNTYEADLADWEARVEHVIATHAVPTVTKFQKSWVRNYGTQYAQVTVEPVDFRDVEAIVGSCPVQEDYPNKYTMEGWVKSVSELNHHIMLLELAVDDEIRLRPTDALARYLTT